MGGCVEIYHASWVELEVGVDGCPYVWMCLGLVDQGKNSF